MSQAYQNLPPTSGKVVITTNVGDIDVELWTKEAPLACRNFVQLCMEGYYDNTMFHRIIPKFMVQGGDPTGTGEGGESVYGAPFKDEIHSRLRFVHRGLVAMANGGRDDNNSQFFFTLGACDWLNGKHTIFGKVTGNTIYNLDAMGEYECDEGDRPLYPPRIITTDVLLHPFDDIVPRDLKKMEEKVDAGPKKKAKKNKSLLSFADDGEAPGIADDEDGDAVVKKKMVSAHDALNDAKLSKEALEVETLPSRSREELEADERAARAAAGIESGDDDDDDDDDDSDDGGGPGGESKSSSDRRKEQYIAVKSNKLKALAAMDDGEGGMEEEQDFKEKERERRKLEMEKLKREIQGMKKGARAVKLKSGEEAVTSGGDKDSDLLTGVQQKRAVLKSKKRVGADREKDTLSKLASFMNSGVKAILSGGKKAKEENEKEAAFTHVGSYGWQEALDDYDDGGWLDGGGLQFKKDSKVGFLQREMENDDSLASYDPLADKRPKKKQDMKSSDPFAGSSAREEKDDRDRGRDRGERSRPDSYVGGGEERGGDRGGRRDERGEERRGGGDYRDRRDDRDDRRRDDMDHRKKDDKRRDDRNGRRH